MPSFTDNVRRIVSSIPVGKVLDYKTLACLAGSPNSAKVAGQAMGPPGETPGWHRVVSNSGEIISPEPHRQYMLLVRDGVKFKHDKAVDMAACRWDGAACGLPTAPLTPPSTD